MTQQDYLQHTMKANPEEVTMQQYKAVVLIV